MTSFSFLTPDEVLRFQCSGQGQSFSKKSFAVKKEKKATKSCFSG
jgi:hypothetical protein